MIIALLLVLGQVGSPTSGIRAKDLVTTAPITFYVDNALGNDTKPCTSTGAGACKTFQGALNKSPKGLRHRVTIVPAAGNYAGAVITGFNVDASIQVATAGLLIDGPFVDVTPATGTASGTATSGTAGSGVTFGTLVHTGQTWTVNDPAIVGKLVNITSGTGNGQMFPVVSNTADTLTVAGTWTSPNGTSVYSIQTPAAVITSCAPAIPFPLGGTASSSAGFMLWSNDNSQVAITIRGIGISAGACSKIVSGQQNGDITLTRMVMTGGTAQGFRFGPSDGSLSLTHSSISTGATTGISIGGAVGFGGSNFMLTLTGAGNGITFTNGAGAGIITTSLSGIQVKANTGVLAIRYSVPSIISGLRCDCSSAANSTCLYADSLGTVDATTVDVTNCHNGVKADIGARVVSTQGSLILTGNALTYGVNAVAGGYVSMATASSTLTAGTAEMTVDTGALTGTFVSLGASNACLISTTGTVSRVCRR